MNLERLYLDYNATSPLSQSVLNWLRSGDILFANPSSQHTDGKSARKTINEARGILFKTFNKSELSTKLFFHSGATEAFHTFAYSFSEYARLHGKELLICSSKIDHPAVTSLSDKYYGPHVKHFDLLRDDSLNYLHEENFNLLKDKKDDNPDLIILYHHLWVHNETGQVSSLEELNLFKNIPDLSIHVDAVQAPGKIMNWQNLSHGDIWTFSGHKFGALKGIGFTFFKNEIEFHPLIMGGSQQSNHRAGTENIHGVKSISLSINDLLKVNISHTATLRDRLCLFLKEELINIGNLIEGPVMASNTIYFYLNDYPSDIALALFDVHGLEISAGSACSSGASKPSAVLVQKGLIDAAKNGLRISLPFDLTEDFLIKIEERLRFVFERVKKK